MPKPVHQNAAKPGPVDSDNQPDSDGVFHPPSGGLIILEQVAAGHCKNVPMMVGKNIKRGVAVLFRPRCKLWSCPECAKTNADLWCMRAVVGAYEFIQAGKDMNFVTLTSHERLSPGATIQALPHQWDMLRKRLNRAVPGVQYFVVPERHRKPRLHLHALVMADLGKRWWKDNARACGMGYMAEDEAVYSAAGAGFYMGKYLTKQLKSHAWKKGFHRVRTSKGWPALPKLERSADWRFEILPRLDSVADVSQRLQAGGFSVALADHRSAWSIVAAYTDIT